MESDRGRSIVPLWDDTDEHLREGPEDASPEKLAPFCDGWVHQFAYSGTVSPGAVYRCQNNITEWGIEWKKDADGRVRIVPRFFNDGKANQISGVSVLEMQGLDDKSVLLVIEEVIARSQRSRIYGFVLDYSKMDLGLCATCVDQGLLFCKGDSAGWTPRQMKTQWDIILEAMQDANPTPEKVPTVAPEPSPKKKTKKRKALVGAPGDVDKEDTKKLTLAQCVKMNEAEVKKLQPKDMKAMKALYKGTFDPMYKWGKKPLLDVSGEPLRVRFDYLHKAPVAQLVYRGIEETRLKGMINKARLETDYQSENRHITVLPIKLGPYGANGQASYYDSCPKKEYLKKDTHYYIIGGQHTVEAYTTLVQNREVPECDIQEASTFNIVPIYAPRAKWTDVIMLSRALN